MPARLPLQLILLCVIGWRPASLAAEKLRLSEEGLQQAAEAVIVAQIEGVRVESEPCEGIANLDWGIYLRLRVESVEKGNVSCESIVARCFRIRQRRWRAEYLAPSGHHPIPPTGTRIRAYLIHSADRWQVVLPNGLTPLEGGGQDAPEVRGLSRHRFAHGLPGEFWPLLTARLRCFP